MNNIQKALEKIEDKHDLFDYKITDRLLNTREYARELNDLLKFLYNIVDDKMFRTLSMSYSPDECKGHNECKKEILQKFNDKLGIK
jgi:hypothetical protein